MVLLVCLFALFVVCVFVFVVCSSTVAKRQDIGRRLCLFYRLFLLFVVCVLV